MKKVFALFFAVSLNCNIAHTATVPCADTAFFDTYQFVTQKKRFAQNALQMSEEVLPSLQKNASEAGIVNEISRDLFFTSLGLLATSAVTLKYATSITGVKFYGYSGWPARYYIWTGMNSESALLASGLVPGLSIKPALLTLLTGSMIGTMAPFNDQTAIKAYARSLKYNPTRAEQVRLTLSLDASDLKAIVRNFVDEMVTKTELRLNIKREKLISRYRDKPNGFFGRNGADYSEALASTELARADLYRFHVSVLLDLEKDLKLVCDNTK